MQERRRLPPLPAVRAFEAAARLGSFALAADELCVTASAVSQQVKALEQWLGVALFRRLPRGLVLTERGRDYQRALTEALEGIHRATERARRRADAATLTLSVVPSFAAHWMVSRLHLFTDSHPDIDVRLSTTTRLVDFTVDDVDAAIRFGRGPYPGLAVEALAEEAVTPVCSPRLLAERPLSAVADLGRHTLLHDEYGLGRLPALGWRHWLAAAGAADAVPAAVLERGPVLADNHLILLAARAGRGVALGRLVLARDELAMGTLVAPFELVVPTGLSYHFVCPPDRRDHPAIAAFRDWLRGEFAEARRPWRADRTDGPDGLTLLAPSRGGDTAV